MTQEEFDEMLLKSLKSNLTVDVSFDSYDTYGDSAKFNITIYFRGNLISDEYASLSLGDLVYRIQNGKL